MTDIPKYRYLIVDDDKFTCDLITLFLTKKGAAEVMVADDGKNAIEKLQAASTLPDIIICDLNMPNLDGVEFLHYLAEELFTGGIILMSGSDKILLNAVGRLGKAQFLTVLGTLEKPFSPDMLVEFLSQYNDDRQASSG